MSAAAAALRDLWTQAGGDPAVLARVTLTGADPVLPTDFRIGTAEQSCLGHGGIAWR